MRDRASWLVAGVLVAVISSFVSAAGPEQGLVVSRGTFSKVLNLSGSIASGRGERYAVPVIPGYWRNQIEWLVDDGAQVAEGDVLVRLDASSLSAELEQSRASLAEKTQARTLALSELSGLRLEAEAELRKAEVAYEKARLDGAVPEDLLAGRDYSEYQIELEKARRGVDEARLVLATVNADEKSSLKEIDIEIGGLQATVSRLEDSVDLLTIRARRHGTVQLGINPRTGHHYKVGDTVRIIECLVETPDPEALEVRAQVSETDLRLVGDGLPARLRLDAYPEQIFNGEVKEIGAVGETRDEWGKAPHYRVRIAIEQPDITIMRPGMSVQCRLEVQHLDNVLLLPIGGVAAAGETLWVRPDLGEWQAVVPLGINESWVAVADDAGAREGQRLSMWTERSISGGP